MKTTFLFFFLGFFCLELTEAQSQTNINAVDSLLRTGLDSLLVLSEDSVKTDSVNKTFIPTLDELIKKGRRFSLQSSEIQLELNNNLDSGYLASEIQDVTDVISALENRMEITNQNFNFRYVNALDRILKKTADQTNDLDEEVQAKLDRLYYLDSLLENIRNDDFFKYKMRDSTLLPNYSLELTLLKKNITSIDSTIFSQELEAARFQSQISLITIKIHQLEEYVEKSKSQLEKTLLTKEINFLWEDYSIASPKSILKITLDSITLNWVLFKRQIRDHIPSTIFSIIFLLLIGWLVRRAILKLKKEDVDNSLILNKLEFLPKASQAGVMIAFIPILVFLFDLGSIAFVTFTIFLQILIATIFIYRSFSRGVLLKWLAVVLIFIFYSLSNLYWEIAYQERMYFLIGNLFLLYLLVVVKERFQTENESEARLMFFVRFFAVGMLSLGVLANIFGRFSLAKILSVAGVSGFTQAVTLFFFVKLLTEIVFLLVENQGEKDSLTAFLNFKEIQKRLRTFLILVATVIWVIILLQNLALNTYFMDMVTEFLSKERKLGDTTFTFGSLCLFAVLIYVSSILANNIAYFISLKDQKTTSDAGKKLGSSVLIVRLVVLTIGFFFAATAAKIPLDKITLVLGALSVGIGFGLQTIINNLVSGVILAFERPIQIGDDIEVGNMSGKVKEVGIRASKILAYDGSEIVVPNGDLLSQSLINWTLSDRRRRVELIIGVAYDSEMKKVRQLIQEVLDREKVMKYPEPKIYMQNFGESSVDFRVLFWVETMDIYLEMRNEVMTAIFESFLENGIEIPFPKRDLYIKTIPESKLGLDQEDDQKKSPEDQSAGEI